MSSGSPRGSTPERGLHTQACAGLTWISSVTSMATSLEQSVLGQGAGLRGLGDLRQALGECVVLPTFSDQRLALDVLHQDLQVSIRAGALDPVRACLHIDGLSTHLWAQLCVARLHLMLPLAVARGGG